MAVEKNRHIVVVDDDVDIQDLITAFFKPKGYQVTRFSDAESALKSAATKGTTWDVLLCDLKLPKMSGVEFTIKVKELLPQIPVILITTSKSAEIAVDAVRKGAYDFIVKPIHFPQLHISVERALHLKDLNHDLVDLRERVKLSVASGSKIIGKSAKFLEALDVARRVAKSKANILISGESGTGKEIFARFVHTESLNPSGPFVAINCSAIPENLLESELFGHAKGAFTGANEKKIGLFEEAQNGTLFLDEIGDLSLPLQAKLLRVLQERKIRRVGENQTRAINCRVISATHKDLVLEVREGRFREDLFFRLNVIPILIPALRERAEDLIPLAEAFRRRFAAENESQVKGFSKEAVRFILENPWRGNVRELENSIERAVVLARGPEISIQDMQPLSGTSIALKAISATADSLAGTSDSANESAFKVGFDDKLPLVDDVLNQYIAFAVAFNQGARDKTAKEIGIDRKTLYKRLRTATGIEEGLEAREPILRSAH